ncbi:preprotein translocase subunit SecA [Corynebacterium poyangense]|uniref:Preprotein translocase subunit SecA n=1 Tax=Corynebacterium poyangense TaxID=2684405 RepID=A0A7H0SRS7_9CORY|nr:DUF5926 family protein [Corynebacterium poyangense]MBZ8176686.1 preprotein translocase subunit SecA [Corynebacterium poyangense]QNQ91252.1 preprotein translocase subunit SecA [Corynebacterium poyangense]
MAKKNRKTQQLPEGMSRRQAKLAARAAERSALDRDPRPFGGLAMEADLIALQEFVPSAAALLPLTIESPRPVQVVTVLPGAAAAVVREDDALVALQAGSRSQNPGRDLAYAINWVVNAEVGETLGSAIADGSEPQLKDLVRPDASLDVKEYEDFHWWLPDNDPSLLAPEMAASLQAANDAIIPSTRIHADIPGCAWWVDPGTKAHIRWIFPTDSEDQLLRALARVAARGDLALGEGSKFAGVFRTHGIIVPVFDVDRTQSSDSFAPLLEALAEQLHVAYQDETSLDSEERRKLQNIKSREVTIR